MYKYITSHCEFPTASLRNFGERASNFFSRKKDKKNAESSAEIVTSGADQNIDNASQIVVDTGLFAFFLYTGLMHTTYPLNTMIYKHGI